MVNSSSDPSYEALPDLLSCTATAATQDSAFQRYLNSCWLF